MKAEEILQKNANKTMKHWELKRFKITHPTLYKTIIDSINEAINYTHSCTELRDEYLQPELDKYKNIKIERTKGKSDM
jgi:hypothetical protein|tara:strand:+ start:310 stop:543 length:234 start_codon:yes stop_codon:yes gene_type:complete